MSVMEAYNKVCSLMDDQGMLPAHGCKKCGKPLNEDGYHPAKLYLGTYTGLCYTCQNAGPYVTMTFFDGAHKISYPPHCPSWRRDRETYTSYPDCPECNGIGRHYISRADSLGGSYYSYCPACSDRFHNHPARKALWGMHERMERACTEYYHGLLRKERLITKARKGIAPADKIARLRKLAQARYTAYLERLEAIQAHIHRTAIDRAKAETQAF